jgi:hypothetical protein
MGSPVEMEFAVDLNSDPAWFGFLQIRRLVVGSEPDQVRLDSDLIERSVLFSEKALGNGVIDGITDIVYVDPEVFDSAHTQQIASDVAALNASLRADDRPYILIGPGRWGSSDPWLGIPVSWEQISYARVIVESGLKDFRVTPSQGTHFFQNITSLRIGYFTINPYRGDGRVDWAWFRRQRKMGGSDHVHHIRTDEPVKVRVDGQSGRGVVLPPDVETEQPGGVA